MPCPILSRLKWTNRYQTHWWWWGLYKKRSFCPQHNYHILVLHNCSDRNIVGHVLPACNKSHHPTTLFNNRIRLYGGGSGLLPRRPRLLLAGEGMVLVFLVSLSSSPHPRCLTSLPSPISTTRSQPRPRAPPLLLATTPSSLNSHGV
ncbi:hypothetical protein QVD17_19144 [Tagetes erecta]|uniref:Uncharacterized protein n=1 Tax=Tagetes erecta TaxID=13708 RepID=A0AAD8KQF7_TARER|nr:hypothetical protein QVD17_19144 [Tagetes erecta]